MAQLNRLPQFARDLLASCPMAGAGIHRWLFRIARVLHPFYDNKRDLALLLEAASAGCGRNIPEQEIVDAIRNSEPYAWKAGKPTPTRSATSTPWPAYQRDLAKGICEKISATESSPGGKLFDRDALIRRSVVGNPDSISPRTVLRLLHASNDPIICLGVTTKFIRTALLSEWDASAQRQQRDSHLNNFQFIVPNAMRAKEGTAQSGKTSCRCRDNAAQHRRFVILEFDQKGDETMQPALHWHLREWAPLVMCVHSGGESIHGWFYVAPQTDEWQLKFFRYAVQLGADPRMWWPEQFSRMPNGKRRDEHGNVVAPQPMIYFDPACIAALETEMGNG